MRRVGPVRTAHRCSGSDYVDSPPQESSSCSRTRWTGHEQRVVPSPFTMQMWEQPPLSHVHGCLPGGTEAQVRHDGTDDALSL